MRPITSRKRSSAAAAMLASVAIGAVAIPPAFSAPNPRVRDGILIKTHITFGDTPTGEVLRGSFIGDFAFCRGGRFRDRAGDDAVTKTFRCPDGRLKIRFQPLGNPDASTASGPWRIVGGSGRFEGVHGRGWMAAKFRGDEGRETFTGRVTR